MVIMVMTMFVYLTSGWIAAAVDYCCCCRLFQLLLIIAVVDYCCCCWLLLML